MKARIYCIVALTILMNYNSFSQASSAPAGNNPALKEAALKANQQRLQEKNKSTESIASTSPTYVGQLNENDKYMGKGQEFLNMTTLESLPADFPQYQKGWDFVEYDGRVEKYFKEHKQILKDVYKAKF
jgi:hypothetical protein